MMAFQPFLCECELYMHYAMISMPYIVSLHAFTHTCYATLSVCFLLRIFAYTCFSALSHCYCATLHTTTINSKIVINSRTVKWFVSKTPPTHHSSVLICPKWKSMM